ncbi:dipeptidase 1-like [Ptychodera flava]|uniref:dipeptidase 1-like n=1 Tax=Ptychodera flava TaxID=63121 RepID=UPI00396A6335
MSSPKYEVEEGAGSSSVENLVKPSKSSFLQSRYIVIIGIVAVVAVVVAVSIAVPVAVSRRQSDPLTRAKNLMREVPLVDGHNDLPWQLKSNFDNQLQRLDLNEDTSNKFGSYGHTDIPRLRQGLLGAQFWAAYMSCSAQYKDALSHTLQQIDVIKRFVAQYPDVFEFVTTAQGIMDAFNNGKIGSLIGMEGGNGMDSDLGVLRMLYDLGVRYMTITHSCNTPWADNWTVDRDRNPEFNGLSAWGETLIKEMNRLGMLIDLSHVSADTMRDSLEVTTAPVIYSHSSAYELCNHYRNVPDDVLKLVKDNGGVVMVNFYDKYVCCYPKNDTTCDLKVVADHIEYIRDVCGIDCVGIGSDYDGVTTLPEGLEDVTTYPALIAELIERSWSDEDIKKLLGLNLIRAFEEAEKVRDSMKDTMPYDDPIPRAAPGEADNKCRYYVYNQPSN